MVRKAIKLISLFVVVAVALYIVTFNGSPTTIYFSGSNSFQASTGVVLIITFALGVLAASLIATFFAFKSYFRERHLLWKDRQAQEFFSVFLKARGVSAIGAIDKAEDLWETLIKSDPTSTIARVELAKLLLKSKRAKEALRVLDEARAKDPDSLEILRLAADVNLDLKNKTAALDNLTLLVARQPTADTASLARDVAEELNRPEEALRFHETLYSLGERGAQYKAIKTRLEFKVLMQKTNQNDSDALRTAVSTFLKKNKQYPLALAKLATLEQKKDNPQKAAQLLADAARSSGDASYWYDAAKLWLKNNSPESALSAARTAVREADGLSKVHAELDLIRLHIALSRLTEAREAIADLTARIKREHPALENDLSQTVLILHALCLNRLGEHREAGSLLTQLSKFEFSLPEPEEEKHLNSRTSAPAPRLSTP